MTEISKQSQELSRSHAQGRGLPFVIVVTTTPLLGISRKITYYRTNPAKYDLNFTISLHLRYNAENESWLRENKVLIAIWRTV